MAVAGTDAELAAAAETVVAAAETVVVAETAVVWKKSFTDLAALIT